MNAHAQDQRQENDRFLRAIAVVGGILWVAVVVWFLTFALGRVEVATADGSLAGPTGTQMAFAYALTAVFALPGAGLVIYGIRRRFKGEEA